MRHFIPIHLNLRERYAVAPAMFTASAKRGKVVEPEIVVTVNEEESSRKDAKDAKGKPSLRSCFAALRLCERSSTPTLVADGAWKIKNVRKNPDGKFVVRLAKLDSVTSDFPSGRLLVVGDLGEPPIVVPVHVAFSP